MTTDLKSSAGLNGTTVTAEELFYNCPSRRRTLKYPGDEMNRIADVVIRYAINNPLVLVASIMAVIASAEVYFLESGKPNTALKTYKG